MKTYCEIKDKKPNPGSEEAILQGCTCPVIDNHYGKGWHGEEGVFIFSEDCPVHNPKNKQKENFQ